MWITINLYGSGDPVLINLSEVLRVLPVELGDPGELQAKLFGKDGSEYESAGSYDSFKRQLSGLSPWTELTNSVGEQLELVNLDQIKKILPDGEGVSIFTDTTATDRSYLVDFSLVSATLSAPVAGEDILGNKL